MHTKAGASTTKIVKQTRYSSVAIALHWTIAAAIALQIVLGWRIGDVEGVTRSAVLQLHKTIGVTILVLTVARLAWRMINRPPPVDSSLTPMEKAASHGVHLAFYGALLALPLTGWAMVSAQRVGAMKLLGGVRWPDFPIVTGLPGAVQDTLADVMDKTHTALVWLMFALLALHVLGALKHHFVSKDPTVARMAPGAKPGRILEPRLIAIPLVVAALAGIGYAIKAAEPPARPKIAKLGDADIFLDVVQPVLNHRCGYCHNDDQPKGGLSLASYEGIVQGGRGGSSIVAGNAAKSELYHRVILPSADPKYMPKEGKTPLSKNEITAVAWWIAQGAPRSAKISSLKLTPEAKVALTAIVGGDEGAGEAGSKDAPLPVVPAADPAQIKKLEGEGFILRPLTKGSNLLVADYVSPKPTTPEVIADLAKLGPQLFDLNLRHAGITDAAVHTIAGFSHLRRLRLEENAITDAAARDIAGLKDLTYLNLTNTKVADAGFAAVAALPNLRDLYVWGTAVTPPAIDRVKAERKGVTLYAGLTAKDVKPETKVMTPTN
ncbi:MAG: cytochrome b/b6 domain-containing protein [Caulobacteraceae bacterium]